MAYTVLQLETQIATYLGRDSVADLMQNGQDIGVYGLNSARRRAEQAHDFKLSEINAFLAIPTTGASLASAYQSTTLTVTGTLTPNVAGTYTLTGTFAGMPLYILPGTTSYFIFFSQPNNEWFISSSPTTNSTPSPGWGNAAGGPTNITGTYNHGAGATGTATVTGNTTAVNVKRVKSVLLPLISGEYQPIEFLTDEQFISRARMQLGREYFNPGTSLTNLGVYLGGNALCYQLGQSLFLSPSTLSFPITAQLLCVQFLAEYTSGSSQTDWFTTYAPEYLYWQGVIEVNNFFKRYTTGRIEGQVDVAEVQSFADKALDALMNWDISIVRSTSTPGSQGSLPPPAPVAPMPQQAA